MNGGSHSVVRDGGCAVLLDQCCTIVSLCSCELWEPYSCVRSMLYCCIIW